MVGDPEGPGWCLNLLFLFLNPASWVARLAEGDRNRLLATFDLPAAAGFQRAFLVLLHDLVDLAFSLRACCCHGFLPYRLAWELVLRSRDLAETFARLSAPAPV